MGSLCLIWFPALIVLSPEKTAGSGVFMSSVSTAFSEIYLIRSYLTPHFSRPLESLPLPLGPPQHLHTDQVTRISVCGGGCGCVTCPDVARTFRDAPRCPPQPPPPPRSTREYRNSAEKASTGGEGVACGGFSRQMHRQGPSSFLLQTDRSSDKREAAVPCRLLTREGTRKKEKGKDACSAPTYTLPGPSTYLPFVHPHRCPGEHLHYPHFIDRKPRLSHAHR